MGLITNLMTNQSSTTVKSTSGVSLTQKIALMFVVSIGVIVVGSVACAAIITWTSKDTTTQTASATVQKSAPAVLGSETDFTFTIGPTDGTE